MIRNIDARVDALARMLKKRKLVLVAWSKVTRLALKSAYYRKRQAKRSHEGVTYRRLLPLVLIGKQPQLNESIYAFEICLLNSTRKYPVH
jgi:hypothetical protein